MKRYGCKRSKKWRCRPWVRALDSCLVKFTHFWESVEPTYYTSAKDLIESFTAEPEREPVTSWEDWKASVTR